MGARRKKSKKPSGTRAEQLLRETIFFVDYCLGRQAGEALRAAGLRVEFHTDHFKQDEPDLGWLPEMGKRGWVVLTKDKEIRRKQVERDAVLESKVRMFALGSGNMTGQEIGEVFCRNRLKMARFIMRNNHPFIASVTQSGITLVAPTEDEQQGETDA
jgi:hypothetical protein